jgi:DNA-binding LacI/PurR family transcriptional regulator
VAGPVTMKDVAARVGVTAATVSMALAGHGRISEATRTAVREAADELGYVPSSAGRALRSRRADAIALIVPHSSAHVFGHLYFMHVLTGMSSVANARDAQVIVSTNADTVSGGAAYARVLRSGAADGVLVTSAAVGDPHVRALVESGLPAVLIGNHPDLPDAVCVGIDDVAASADITAHLLAVHGRRRLLHVSGPLDHQTGIDRRAGFLAAAERAGAASADVVEGDLAEPSGARAIAEQLERGPFAYDGVVFANDDMAVGGLRALRTAGVDVPGRVSVVGFDDFGLARVVEPPITTVAVPAERMAAVAAERLFELIDGRSVHGRTRLPVTLVVRRSCGCT